MPRVLARGDILLSAFLLNVDHDDARIVAESLPNACRLFVESLPQVKRATLFNQARIIVK